MFYSVTDCEFSVWEPVVHQQHSGSLPAGGSDSSSEFSARIVQNDPQEPINEVGVGMKETS